MKKLLRETVVFLITSVVAFALTVGLVYAIAHLGGGIDKSGAKPGTTSVILLSVFSMLFAVFIQTLLHEAGHLVCGLSTGYRFLSFRILNWAVVKALDGRFSLRTYSVPGTIGQCLLVPPTVGDKLKTPYFWYNAGGVFFNFLSILVLLVVLASVKVSVALFLVGVMNVVVGFFFMVLNGIPMSNGGLYNDGKNTLCLFRNKALRENFYNQLAVNALMTYGKRLCEMPDRLFAPVKLDDYSNTILLSSMLANASREEDCGNMETAYGMMREVWAHESRLPNFFRNDIKAECMMLACLTGRHAATAGWEDPKLERYLAATVKFSAGKVPPLYALELLVRNDSQKAQAIREKMEAHENKYVYPGEVRMAKALMERIDMYKAGDAIN